MAEDKKLMQIKGRVIDSKTNTGIAALRVEAWDKGLTLKEPFPVLSAIKPGAFTIETHQRPSEGIESFWTESKTVTKG